MSRQTSLASKRQSLLVKAKPTMEVGYLLRGFSALLNLFELFYLLPSSDYAWTLSSKKHSSEKPTTFFAPSSRPASKLRLKVPGSDCIHLL